MKSFKAMSFLLPLVSLSSVVTAQTWSHSGAPAQIIELYTSEGCSSCPPADKYLSNLNGESELWVETIPMAFHVDYWDYLGWKDPYAQPSFTLRQQLYRKYGVVSSVYTPGFVVDGKEWRGFFNWLDQSLPQANQSDSLRLTMSLKGNQVNVTYEQSHELDLTLVAIATSRTSKVKAGENRGKQLDHSFVVLEQHQQRSSDGKWTIDIAAKNYDVLAAWVTTSRSFVPLQTVAGKVER